MPVKSFTGPSDLDLTGNRFGRLVVTGASAEWKSNSMGTAWVVRCDCGYFEIRRSKTIRKQEARTSKMCSHCDILEAIKNGEHQSRDDVGAS